MSRLKQSATEAATAPVSSPTGRALVLRIGRWGVAATALATGALFHMYETAKAEAAFVDLRNLTYAPPDPDPALVGAILGAAVTLLLAGAMVEVATGTGLVALLRRAAARLAVRVRFRRARRSPLQPAIARPPLPVRLA